MKRNLLMILGIYLGLLGVCYLGMHEVSPRHTVFLLVDAILFMSTLHYMDDKRQFVKGMIMCMGLLCSIFIIRFLTPVEMKAWEVYTFLSFSFALCNILLILTSVIPHIYLKRAVVLMGGMFVLLPTIICWGYYFSEHAWLNVEAVMAALQTNSAEAFSYIHDRTGFMALVLIFFLAVILFLMVKFLGKISVRKLSAAGYVVLLVLFALSGVLLVRTSDNFVLSIYEETKDYQREYDEYARQREERQHNLEQNITLDAQGQDGVFVLVIGESENRDHMSAYGYNLETTPWLDKMASDPNMILFQNAYSCHVQTVPVITYAMTEKNQYNTVELEKAVSLIEVAKAAGYETVWLSNQVRYGSWGTPISVIADAADKQIWINSHQGNTLDTDYYDEELVNKLDEIKPGKKMLIVLHLMGSHISYQDRYPATFEKFMTDGNTGEYDNSILYNDFVMSKLLDKVASWQNFKGLVYFSDHSEAIDSGKSHNPATFSLDMTNIPLYMYFAPTWQQDNAQRFSNLRQAKDYYFTNDLIFDTMLGIMGITSSQLTDSANDLSADGYNHDLARFKTLYGKKSIQDVVKK